MKSIQVHFHMLQLLVLFPCFLLRVSGTRVQYEGGTPLHIQVKHIHLVTPFLEVPSSYGAVNRNDTKRDGKHLHTPLNILGAHTINKHAVPTIEGRIAHAYERERLGVRQIIENVRFLRRGMGGGVSVLQCLCVALLSKDCMSL